MGGARNYLTSRREIEVCSTKIKYYSKPEAQRQADRMRAGTGWNARVYRCPGIKGERRHFHVTSGKKW